jgi:hypothetical protein
VEGATLFAAVHVGPHAESGLHEWAPQIPLAIVAIHFLFVFFVFFVFLFFLFFFLKKVPLQEISQNILFFFRKEFFPQHSRTWIPNAPRPFPFTGASWREPRAGPPTTCLPFETRSRRRLKPTKSCSPPLRNTAAGTAARRFPVR